MRLVTLTDKTHGGGGRQMCSDYNKYENAETVYGLSGNFISYLTFIQTNTPQKVMK